MAAGFNLEQIRAAMAASDPAYSFYLDLDTGEVVKVPDTDESPEAEALRTMVMESYGERFRYIPGGKADPGDGDVREWMAGEGL